MHIPQHPELLHPQPEFLPTDPHELIKNGFRELCNEGHILGAFPFGSVQTGTHSPLSDYDILVAVREMTVDEETTTFRILHNKARQLYGQTHLPLEVSLCTQTELESGRHDFSYQMLTYLRTQRHQFPQNVIGSDFIMKIAYQKPAPTLAHPAPLFAAANEHVKKTRDHMKKQWFQGVYSSPHELLARVLDVPHTSARKVIDPLQSFGFTSELFSDLTHGSLYKAGVDFLRGFPAPLSKEVAQAEELFTTLIRAKQRFVNDFLPEVQREAITEEEYDQIILAVLEENLPFAIEFLRRFQELYSKLGWDTGYHHKTAPLC